MVHYRRSIGDTEILRSVAILIAVSTPDRDEGYLCESKSAFESEPFFPVHLPFSTSRVPELLITDIISLQSDVPAAHRK